MTTRKKQASRPKKKARQGAPPKVRIIAGIIAVAIIAIILLGTPAIKRAEQARTLEMIEKKLHYTPDFILQHLVSSGIEKEGIQSIDQPGYVSAIEADEFLQPTDIVFGAIIQGQAYAYPKAIMAWHEIVNDWQGGEQFSVTYCPLTGTAIGYYGRELGISGRLYNNNLVLIDRETGSLIPQMLGMAIDGPLEGQRPLLFPVSVTTWQQWKSLNPSTKVLSSDTGSLRDYRKNPFQQYENNQGLRFPVVAKSSFYPAKKVVTGIEVDGSYLAIPKEELKTIVQLFFPYHRRQLTIVYDQWLDGVTVYDGPPEDGQRLYSFDSYWFAWYAHHPETDVVAIDLGNGEEAP